MKTEIEKRHLKIAVNFSIPKQQRKSRQLELGLKGAGYVLLNLKNQQPTNNSNNCGCSCCYKRRRNYC
ncbi:hypothetical protein [Tenacibaculum sp. SZ-18]|uniref:hypothetical protein n=1 Tax=Tenacibaculum sp. SZ-18 TaxID=754423 RepID=UPI0012FE1058|nr:hypothetical protein [Tenacibaculum sp. SZ-18]